LGELVEGGGVEDVPPVLNKDAFIYLETSRRENEREKRVCTFMVSSQPHVAMKNSTTASLVAHLRRKVFGSSDALVGFLLPAIIAC